MSGRLDRRSWRGDTIVSVLVADGWRIAGKRGTQIIVERAGDTLTIPAHPTIPLSANMVEQKIAAAGMSPERFAELVSKTVGAPSAAEPASPPPRPAPSEKSKRAPEA